LGAEEFDGGFEALAGVPEIGPEVALFLEARTDGFDVEAFWFECGAEFARVNRRGDGSFGKRADGVGGGERTALGVLRDVNQDAARGTFRDGAFAGDEIRMLGGDAAGDDFREGAQLFVGVNGFDGNEDVETGSTGSF